MSEAIPPPKRTGVRYAVRFAMGLASRLTLGLAVRSTSSQLKV